MIKNGLNIISNSEFVEEESEYFFMRSEYTGEVNENLLITQLQDILLF